MRLTLIRLFIIAAIYLLVRFAIEWPEALLIAFVVEYVIEPAVLKQIIKP